MSLILALDTSTRNAALALFDSRSGHSWTAGDIRTQNHGRELIPAIERLIASSGSRFDALEAIVVGIGPGSYTGLRVGIAVAKTLAEVLQIPVHPLDSLLLPVLASTSETGRLQASVADAQRGAVALSIYRLEGSPARWTRCQGPEIVAWGDSQQICRTWNVECVTGPGLELSSRFGPIGIAQAPPQSWFPNSATLLEWIRGYFGESKPVDIDTLEPDYLRPSAAEEKRQAAAAPAATQANS